MSTRSRTTDRAVAAVRSVLPAVAQVHVVTDSAPRIELEVGGQPMTAHWVGEGTLGRVRRLLAEVDRPLHLVVARRMSSGARSTLSGAGVGWVDETGAAEIAFGPLLVSRTGHVERRVAGSARWNRSVLAVAESLLCGSAATVDEVVVSTGLSMGASAKALQALASLNLLEADAARGRRSGRRVRDARVLLEAYAEAAGNAPPGPRLEIGVSWQDAVDGLTDVGRTWDEAGTLWVASGQVAAAVLAPLFTSVRSAIVYVEARTLPGLEAVAGEAGLRPIEGGRLTLASFPTITTNTHSAKADGLRVAPWPRVFADLQAAGVRGEEAAEYLWEVMSG